MGSPHFVTRLPRPLAAICALVLLLSACGGGGGAGAGSVGSVGSASIVNRAPTIGGVPAASVDTGSTFEFQPVANDADGNRLRFTIANKPGWARFDPATGRLSGVPTVDDLGNSADILISVSDGALTAALPAFQIQVTGTALLSWSAPTQNVDGSELKDLAGYRIYYGASVATMVAVAIVTDPAQQTYRLGGLTRGTWYFAVAAVNSEGTESNLSNIGTKTLG